MQTSILHEKHMVLKCDVTNGWTVIEVIGDIDVHTSPMIRAAIIKLLDEGHHHFILDLRPVSILDSMGLGMIVAVTKRIRDHDGSLRLVCIDEHTLKVFRISGLRKVYAFHDSVDQATRDAPRSGGLSHWPHHVPT